MWVFIILVDIFVQELVCERVSPFTLSEHSDFLQRPEEIEDEGVDIVNLQKSYENRFVIKGIVKNRMGKKVFIYDLQTKASFYLSEQEEKESLLVLAIHSDKVQLSYQGVQFELFVTPKRPLPFRLES